ncbi:hypothetical protein LUZ63_003236 [Rhynchospora breviuscula]|uniref:DUF309 domain-containing protein n=1 Tax=Rhynchospora breviuscula TaxID=2022672 RepID=A0A9Q0D094_9POAL|nr:hypothetical protein LUZ63_003236 [Rhynchospora breviuscula]
MATTASTMVQNQILIPSRGFLSSHSKPSQSLPFSLPFPLSSRTRTTTSPARRSSPGLRPRRRLTGGIEPLESPETESEQPTFDLAVKLFNGGEFYRCHDVLEEMWYSAEEPIRTLLHGILQCAVGFHHLLNQNHRGAMIQLGEGLCKIKKLEFKEGPFFQFQQEISAALEFVYQTQKELAACNDEYCLTMDGSEKSYQLLGSFGAGQQLYSLNLGSDAKTHILFSAPNHYSSERPSRVKAPILGATEKHLIALRYISKSDGIYASS